MNMDVDVKNSLVMEKNQENQLFVDCTMIRVGKTPPTRGVGTRGAIHLQRVDPKVPKRDGIVFYMGGKLEWRTSCIRCANAGNAGLHSETTERERLVVKNARRMGWWMS